jgi:predicted nucleotidyltransferase component of viral defense system
VLAFKGGTALRRCWFEDYRFSEDLDFTLTWAITLEDILAGLTKIYATVEVGCVSLSTAKTAMDIRTATPSICTNRTVARTERRKGRYHDQ